MRSGAPSFTRWQAVWDARAVLESAVSDSRWDWDLEELMRGVSETSVRCMEMAGCWEGRLVMMGERWREVESPAARHDRGRPGSLEKRLWDGDRRSGVCGLE